MIGEEIRETWSIVSQVLVSANSLLSLGFFSRKLDAFFVTRAMKRRVFGDVSDCLLAVGGGRLAFERSVPPAFVVTSFTTHLAANASDLMLKSCG